MNKWETKYISDQKGKVIIITGATSGLGKEDARVLTTKNAKVIMAVRNTEKGEKVAEAFRKSYASADVEVRQLDLSSLASVRSFAASFLEDYDRLDVLINNAGVMACPYSKTADGFEIQFGTNHLGHFALTGLLMPLLKKTSNAKIVAVSSMAHTSGNLDFNDLNWEKRTYKTWNAYGDSKISNLYFAYELARKLQKDGNNPRVTAAHPGYTATDLQRHSSLFGFLNLFLAQKVEMGVLPTLMAAFEEDVKPGTYYGPAKMGHSRGYPMVHESNELSYDEAIAKKLWTVSAEMTGVVYDL